MTGSCGARNWVVMSQKTQGEQTSHKDCGENQKPPNRELLTPKMHENRSDQTCLNSRDDQPYDEIPKMGTKVHVGHSNSQKGQKQKTKK
jgi:hypothetical protein